MCLLSQQAFEDIIQSFYLFVSPLQLGAQKSDLTSQLGYKLALGIQANIRLALFLRLFARFGKDNSPVPAYFSRRHLAPFYALSKRFL